jgi:hypothetical protein
MQAHGMKNAGSAKRVALSSLCANILDVERFITLLALVFLKNQLELIYARMVILGPDQTVHLNLLKRYGILNSIINYNVFFLNIVSVNPLTSLAGNCSKGSGSKTFFECKSGSEGMVGIQS